MKNLIPRHAVLFLLVALWLGTWVCAGQDPNKPTATDFGAVFDQHWQRLEKDYPYFKLYGVDWDAERADHRPRAVAAANATEFAWEMARLVSVLPDAHVSYRPPMAVIKGWSAPDLLTATVERRPLVLKWGEGLEPTIPPAFVGDRHAYPEIISVAGTRIGCATEILAAGPVSTTFTVRLRWPDNTETDQLLRRPAKNNLPPKRKHFGKRWIVSGRVGSVGYLRVKTFAPRKATLGRAGKMTPILREHLAKLGDTKSLILDLQSNGGGVVGASDPFLSHFLTKRTSYKWGNSGGQRLMMPRSPHYAGDVVALVDEKSASGGEWAARILRDAGRAKVVGGRTSGAEAAVQTSNGADGSKVSFSAWPMVEPNITPFQDRGVTLDHALPLTIEDVRHYGYDEAKRRVRRARFAKALQILGAPSKDVEALVSLADDADRKDQVENRPR